MMNVSKLTQEVRTEEDIDSPEAIQIRSLLIIIFVFPISFIGVVLNIIVVWVWSSDGWFHSLRYFFKALGVFDVMFLLSCNVYVWTEGPSRGVPGVNIALNSTKFTQAEAITQNVAEAIFFFFRFLVVHTTLVITMLRLRSVMCPLSSSFVSRAQCRKTLLALVAWAIVLELPQVLVQLDAERLTFHLAVYWIVEILGLCLPLLLHLVFTSVLLWNINRSLTSQTSVPSKEEAEAAQKRAYSLTLMPTLILQSTSKTPAKNPEMSINALPPIQLTIEQGVGKSTPDSSLLGVRFSGRKKHEEKCKCPDTSLAQYMDGVRERARLYVSRKSVQEELSRKVIEELHAKGMQTDFNTGEASVLKIYEKNVREMYERSMEMRMEQTSTSNQPQVLSDVKKMSTNNERTPETAREEIKEAAAETGKGLLNRSTASDRTPDTSKPHHAAPVENKRGKGAYQCGQCQICDKYKCSVSEQCQRCNFFRQVEMALMVQEAFRGSGHEVSSGHRPGRETHSLTIITRGHKSEDEGERRVSEAQGRVSEDQGRVNQGGQRCVSEAQRPDVVKLGWWDQQPESDLSLDSQNLATGRGVPQEGQVADKQHLCRCRPTSFVKHRHHKHKHRKHRKYRKHSSNSVKPYRMREQDDDGEDASQEKQYHKDADTPTSSAGSQEAPGSPPQQIRPSKHSKESSRQHYADFAQNGQKLSTQPPQKDTLSPLLTSGKDTVSPLSLKSEQCAGSSLRSAKDSPILAYSEKGSRRLSGGTPQRSRGVSTDSRQGQYDEVGKREKKKERRISREDKHPDGHGGKRRVSTGSQTRKRSEDNTEERHAHNDCHPQRQQQGADRCDDRGLAGAVVDGTELRPSNSLDAAPFPADKDGDMDKKASKGSKESQKSSKSKESQKSSKRSHRNSRESRKSSKDSRRQKRQREDRMLLAHLQRQDTWGRQEDAQKVSHKKSDNPDYDKNAEERERVIVVVHPALSAGNPLSADIPDPDVHRRDPAEHHHPESERSRNQSHRPRSRGPLMTPSKTRQQDLRVSRARHTTTAVLVISLFSFVAYPVAVALDMRKQLLEDRSRVRVTETVKILLQVVNSSVNFIVYYVLLGSFRRLLWRRMVCFAHWSYSHGPTLAEKEAAQLLPNLTPSRPHHRPHDRHHHHHKPRHHRHNAPDEPKRGSELVTMPNKKASMTNYFDRHQRRLNSGLLDDQLHLLQQRRGSRHRSSSLLK